MSVVGPPLQGLPSCTAGQFCCTPTLFGDGWNLTTIYADSSNTTVVSQYYTAHLNQTNQGPVAIFYPNITQSGTYQIYIDTPGTIEDGTANQRGQVSLTTHLYSPNGDTAPLIQNTVDQSTVESKSDLVYSGWISQSQSGFVPSLIIIPSALNSTVMVAQQVRFIPKYTPVFNHSLSSGARAGIAVGVVAAVLILSAILYFTSCCCCCCRGAKPKRDRSPKIYHREAASSSDVERGSRSHSPPPLPSPAPPATLAPPIAGVAEMEAANSSGRNTQTTGTPELMAVSPDRKTWNNNEQPPPYSE